VALCGGGGGGQKEQLLSYISGCRKTLEKLLPAGIFVHEYKIWTEKFILEKKSKAKSKF